MPVDVAFPQLEENEIELLEETATKQTCRDGEVVVRAGQADVDLIIVKSGKLDILNPTDDNRLVVSHGPGQFFGDIDILTRRPVIVTAVARGTTEIPPRARLAAARRSPDRRNSRATHGSPPFQTRPCAA